MKRFSTLLAALALVVSALSTARAADLYWDINGTALGGSNTTSATGNWNTATANWNDNSTGGAGTISGWSNANNIAHFSAGTNVIGASTVTLDPAATISADGIFFEE